MELPLTTVQTCAYIYEHIETITPMKIKIPLLTLVKSRKHKFSTEVKWLRKL